MSMRHFLDEMVPGYLDILRQCDGHLGCCRNRTASAQTPGRTMSATRLAARPLSVADHLQRRLWQTLAL